jgi:hypothetical protein
VDGKATLCSQATTYGPKFSREIIEASCEFRAAYLAKQGIHRRSRTCVLEGSDLYEFYRGIVDQGRAAGADIGKWFRGRVFGAVSGAIAEAIVSHRSFHEIWEGYGAESDRNSVHVDAKISGIEARAPRKIAPSVNLCESDL